MLAYLMLKIGSANNRGKRMVVGFGQQLNATRFESSLNESSTRGEYCSNCSRAVPEIEKATLSSPSYRLISFRSKLLAGK